MKDGKIGVGPNCCSLNCDGYGGGGGNACNDDIEGVCCVPGVGGTCGESTQCGCDAAGGTWRFAEVDGQEVAPGVFNKCEPANMGNFDFGGDGNGPGVFPPADYNVCDCEAGSNLTIVWRDLQLHPDYSRTQGDTLPQVACNMCKSFVSIGDAEEFFADKPYAQSHVGVIFCGEHDCYTQTQDPAEPAWLWSDPLIMPGDSDIYSRNCTKIPNYKIPGCLDLDGDGYEEGGTGAAQGDDSNTNPCLDPNNPSYPYCTCNASFYVGFQSGVWSNSTTWCPCSAYGYDGTSPCCSNPDPCDNCTPKDPSCP